MSFLTGHKLCGDKRIVMKKRLVWDSLFALVSQGGNWKYIWEL